MSITKKSSVKNFGDDVLDVVKAYTEEAAETCEETAKDAADMCRDEIEQNAKRYGWDEYGKSWKIKKSKKTKVTTYTVYSPKFYRLAHLLEHGHAKLLWGKDMHSQVSGKPHIGPAERDAEQFFIDEFKARINQL